MMKIDGIDPLRLNKIHEQTGRTEVQTFARPDAENKIREKERPQEKILTQDDRPFMERLEQAVKQSNETAAAINTGIRFKLHESSDRIMVQIVDRMENEVIREIPPEKLLNLIGQIQEMIGLLLDEKR